VTTLPAALDCGSVCEAMFPHGTMVQLVAIPAPNSVFSGWSGEADCLDGEVRMNKERACIAMFDRTPPPSHILSVTSSGDGSGSVASSPAGIDCGSDCNEAYVDGTSVTLTATRNRGSTFEGWDGGCSGSLPEISMTILSDLECSARFEPCTDLRDASGMSIEDPQYLEACTALHAADIQVRSTSGALTLVAGDSVVFDEGFQVLEGGVLAVILDRTLQP
jgi:hypothetical protein